MTRKQFFAALLTPLVVRKIPKKAPQWHIGHIGYIIEQERKELREICERTGPIKFEDFK